ncbi:MAG: NTP transferase domain-containing protein [Candidatus Omnitrophota bacterium]
MSKFTAIVLAAGKGERMNSAQPKVLQDLLGKPLIFYVLRELLSLKKYIKKIVVVIGYQAKTVEKEVKSYFPKNSNIEFVRQPKLNGTAKAVEAALKRAKQDNLLVVCGDAPLITAASLGKLISFYLSQERPGAFLTAVVKRENSLGTVLYDPQGNPKKIIEKIEIGSAASIFQEINSGIYCFQRKALLKNLPEIKPNPRKKEYFLTDLIDLFYQQGEPLSSYRLADSYEIEGINSQEDLVLARKVMRQRIVNGFIQHQVRIIDAETVFIEQGVSIGKNTTIYPFTFIEKGVIIGRNCSLGPFLHLRQGTRIGDDTEVGNFLEINRCRVGNKVKIKHFGYLGDTVVEDKVNIGAGTVVANFDGKKKWKTKISQGSFIGSDTILVAPVKVGKNSRTGAGSVVTKDVKANTVVLGVPARLLKKTKDSRKR